jgi:hypothetical protein
LQIRHRAHFKESQPLSLLLLLLLLQTVRSLVAPRRRCRSKGEDRFMP